MSALSAAVEGAGAIVQIRSCLTVPREIVLEPMWLSRRIRMIVATSDTKKDQVVWFSRPLQQGLASAAVFGSFFVVITPIVIFVVAETPLCRLTVGSVVCRHSRSKCD
eukprot:4209665-Amphidinium_carterae.2